MLCFCALLFLFFTSNSAVFVGGSAKIFLPPGAQGNLAKPFLLPGAQAIFAPWSKNIFAPWRTG